MREPYFLGTWLADADGVIEDYLAGYPALGTADEARDWLSGLGVATTRRIPASYLAASESDRAEVLAGMIDEAGTMLPTEGFVVLLPRKNLADDLAALAAGLGYVGADGMVERKVETVAGVRVHAVLVTGKARWIPTRKFRPRNWPKAGESHL